MLNSNDKQTIIIEGMLARFLKLFASRKIQQVFDDMEEYSKLDPNSAPELQNIKLTADKLKQLIADYEKENPGDKRYSKFTQRLKK